MLKVIKHDKGELLKNISNGQVDAFIPLHPNLVDTILETVEDKYNLLQDIQDVFENNSKHIDAMHSDLFIMASISARLKQISSNASVPMAISSVKLMQKLGLNLYTTVNDSSYFTEGSLRKYINLFKEDLDENNEITTLFNKLFTKMNARSENGKRIHILDCVKIPVNFQNENYEYSTIANDKNKNKMRGYKIGVLREWKNNSGLIEEIVVGTAKTHDLELTKDMLKKSSHLKKDDVLIMDRGFTDLELIKYLKEIRGVDVIIPAKKNMDIFTEAVSLAKSGNNWIKHPEREHQEIAEVNDLNNYWVVNRNSTNFKACVIRVKKDFNFEYSDTDYLSQDENYIYIVLLCTNSKMKAKDIVLTYNKRTDIEEDFRQLKDFWKLSGFKSTKYKFIVFYMCTTLAAYNYYQLFKLTEAGKTFRKKSLPVALEKQKFIHKVQECRVFILSNNYFSIFTYDEIFDIYALLNDESKSRLKHIMKTSTG